jgi:hypothetical protein
VSIFTGEISATLQETAHKTLGYLRKEGQDQTAWISIKTLNFRMKEVAGKIGEKRAESHQNIITSYVDK